MSCPRVFTLSWAGAVFVWAAVAISCGPEGKRRSSAVSPPASSSEPNSASSTDELPTTSAPAASDKLTAADEPLAAVTPSAATANPPQPAAPLPEGPTLAVPTRWPTPPRLIAIGDVHGDAVATRRALQLGGAIDDRGAWIGNDLVVVQTGDQIDRGDDDRAVLDYFDELEDQARAAGGALIVLNGNHEFMNALGDLRYVTPASLRSFDGVPVPDGMAVTLARVPEPARMRLAAFVPGGVYARRLAERNVVAVVGDSVFVHGGVLPQYATNLDELNERARAWLRGDEPQLPPALMADDGPLWSRHYSHETGPVQCKLLDESLAAIGASRMVVGHTPQLSGITSACNDKVWRIDVGMAAFYGGPTQVLEITADGVQVMSSPMSRPDAEASRESTSGTSKPGGSKAQAPAPRSTSRKTASGKTASSNKAAPKTPAMPSRSRVQSGG